MAGIGKCSKCGLSLTGWADFDANIRRYNLPGPAKWGINILIKQMGEKGVDMNAKCPNCGTIITIRAKEYKR